MSYTDIRDASEFFEQIGEAWETFKRNTESLSRVEVDRNTPLAQINRMARQIEECHATLRRRNEQIKNLEADIRTLSAPTSCCCENGEC